MRLNLDLHFFDESPLPQLGRFLMDKIGRGLVASCPKRAERYNLRRKGGGAALGCIAA